MVKKEFTYRGKTMQELQGMDINAFAELCTARVRKSLKNGIDRKLLAKIEKTKADPKIKPARTHRRDIIVVPSLVGARVAVYKGNSFEQLEITEKMLGHYIGEFIFTRKRLQHGKAGIGATKSSTAVTSRKG